MGKLNVIEQPKERFSWTAELVKLEVTSEPLFANIDQRNTIAPLISNQLKYRYPERSFKTKKEVIDKKEYLKIWRTK
jgi:hypothetical protein